VADAPAARWCDISVRYPYADAPAVGPASLAVGRSERVLLVGASGSGKSTLLATLTGLIPHTIPAEVTGKVELRGEDVATRTPAQWSASVGQMFQNPEQTLCGMTVGDEVAFALENQALPADEIEARIGSALAQVGLSEDWRGRRTMQLSGGEKQLVALAALIAQQTPLLVVDEPTAHLAPAAATHLRRLLLDRPGDASVLIVDHRVDDLAGLVDRVVLIDADGHAMDGGSPRAFFRAHYDKLAALGIAIPPPAALDAALQAAGIVLAEATLTMEEAVAWLEALPTREKAAAQEIASTFAVAHQAGQSVQASTKVVAALEGASCAPLFGPTVLRDVSLTVRRGETIAIVGRNGAGKSTLAASLAGLLRLKAGRRIGPMGAISFQNPENQFLAGSVREEVRDAWLAAGADAASAEAKAEAMLAQWGLSELAAAHPFELSQGQKRRLSLAIITAGGRWPLLVLDEPTAGLDGAGRAALEAEIRSLAGAGHAVALVTHDLDFALASCARSVVVDDGGIAADGPSRTVLRDTALLERSGLAAPALLPLLHFLEEGRC